MDTIRKPDIRQQPAGQPTGGTPQPGGHPTLARLFAFIRGLSGKAVVLAGGVLVAQMVLPPEWKPSQAVGAFYGALRKAELDAERQAQAETAEATTGAQTAAQAKQQVTVESLHTQEAISNIGDAACAAAPFVTLFFGRDGESVANALQAGCALGAQARQKMNEALSNAATQGSGTYRNGGN